MPGLGYVYISSPVSKLQFSISCSCTQEGEHPRLYTPPKPKPVSRPSRHGRAKCCGSSFGVRCLPVVTAVLKGLVSRPGRVLPFNEHAPECPICLENISPENKIVTSCNHVFHKQCIEQLKSREQFGGALTKCPLCRSYVIDFTSRLNLWRPVFRADAYKDRKVLPPWSIVDEKCAYAFVIMELQRCGVRYVDMGLQEEHKLFLHENVSVLGHISVPNMLKEIGYI
jgi:hypothetical protein